MIDEVTVSVAVRVWLAAVRRVALNVPTPAAQRTVGRRDRLVVAACEVHRAAAVRNQYLATVIDYNRAQFQLLRSLGLPPEAAASEPKP